MELSQTDRVFIALSDGERHLVPELIRKVYGVKGPSSARLSARIWDLRHTKGLNIESSENKDGRNKRKSPVWWYRMKLDTKFKKYARKT